MDILNFDKLAQIKKKYCYFPQGSAFTRPKSQLCNHKKQQSEISSHIQQKIHSSRKKQQQYAYQNQFPNGGNLKKQCDSATSVYKQYPPTSSKKNTTLNALQILFESPNNQKVVQSFQIKAQRGDISIKFQENFVESYQKTYNLLKNYRKKINSSFKNQTQQKQKILEINSKKLIGIKKDKQNLSPESKQQNATFQCVSQKNTKKQAQNKNAKIYLGNRPNFFESIDISKTDLKAELSHIQKLQNKIKSVLGQNMK